MNQSSERSSIPLPIRLYLLSFKLYKYLGTMAKSVLLLVKISLVGFWLGVFRRPSLYRIDEHYYNQEEPVYASETHNRRGLWAWEQGALEAYFQDCQRVLISSVGGGREALALRQMGYMADAFECNPRLVAQANNLLAQAGLAADVQLAPRDHCPTKLAGPYDGLILGWGAYTNIPGRAQRVAFLREMGQYGRTGSPMLLSFFVRDEKERRFKLIARIANLIRRLLSRELLEIGDVLDPAYQHYFTEQEIAAELAEAGFKLAYFSREEYGHAVGIRLT